MFLQVIVSVPLTAFSQANEAQFYASISRARNATLDLQFFDSQQLTVYEQSPISAVTATRWNHCKYFPPPFCCTS
jgi:hypothetical protein